MDEYIPPKLGEFRDEFEDMYVETDRREEYINYRKEINRISMNFIPYAVREAALVLLDTQRLMNALVSNPVTDAPDLIKAVLSKLKIANLIRICPMLGPSGQLFTEDAGGVVRSHPIFAKTRMLKTRVPKTMDVDKLATEIAKEIDAEILNDMWNVTSGKINIQGNKANKITLRKDATKQKIADAITEMKRRVFTWGPDSCPHIVMGKKFYEDHKEVLSQIKDHWICVSIIDDLPREGILFVSRSCEELKGSFFWCPYVFLTQHEEIYLMRYDKKYLPEKGSDLGLIEFVEG